MSFPTNQWVHIGRDIDIGTNYFISQAVEFCWGVSENAICHKSVNQHKILHSSSKFYLEFCLPLWLMQRERMEDVLPIVNQLMLTLIILQLAVLWRAAN